jgi:hypothetical protein
MAVRCIDQTVKLSSGALTAASPNGRRLAIGRTYLLTPCRRLASPAAVFLLLIADPRGLERLIAAGPAHRLECLEFLGVERKPELPVADLLEGCGEAAPAEVAAATLLAAHRRVLTHRLTRRQDEFPGRLQMRFK